MWQASFCVASGSNGNNDLCLSNFSFLCFAKAGMNKSHVELHFTLILAAATGLPLYHSTVAAASRWATCQDPARLFFQRLSYCETFTVLPASIYSPRLTPGLGFETPKGRVAKFRE